MSVKEINVQTLLDNNNNSAELVKELLPKEYVIQHALEETFLNKLIREPKFTLKGRKVYNTTSGREIINIWLDPRESKGDDAALLYIEVINIFSTGMYKEVFYIHTT